MSASEYYERGDFRRTPSTRYLSHALRRKVIMLRKSDVAFLDPEQNGQCMLDLDIFPEWEEEQKRIEIERQRRDEKPDFSSTILHMARNAAITASENIMTMRAELCSSVYGESAAEDRAPMPETYRTTTTRELDPLIDGVLYPRHRLFSRYLYFSERYNPQADFWKKFYDKMAEFPAPTLAAPLPITAEMYRTPECVTELLSQITMSEELHVYLRPLFRQHIPYYPRVAGLQTEQLVLVKDLFLLLSHLPLTIIREDLPLQISICYAVVARGKALLALLELNYVVREECL